MIRSQMLSVIFLFGINQERLKCARYAQMKTDKRTKYKCGFYGPAFYAIPQLNTFTKFRWTFLVATVFEILKLFVFVFRCTPICMVNTIGIYCIISGIGIIQ